MGSKFGLYDGMRTPEFYDALDCVRQIDVHPKVVEHVRLWNLILDLMT